MPGVETITVKYSKDGIEVKPMKVRLSWEKGKDTVNWIVEKCPEHLNVKIAWNLILPITTHYVPWGVSTSNSTVQSLPSMPCQRHWR